MTTRSSDRWRRKPGSFDTLHTQCLFPYYQSDYGIPTIPHAPLSYIPDWLAPYRTRIRTRSGTEGGAAHFFLDDYRFESVWSRPQKVLSYLSRFRTLLTPDFSLYPDWPQALQIWNTYRSRWCGAWWAVLGFQVIPTVGWADPASFEFCFSGIARHSLVAISTVGVTAKSQKAFARGYEAMLEHLQPSQVLCYGPLPVDLEGLAPVKIFETRWDEIKRNGR